MNASLAELIRQARKCSAERDRLVDALARRWAAALRGQQLTPADLEELWDGLAEEAVRGVLREGGERWTAEAVRQETFGVLARLRRQVEQALAAPDDGKGSPA
jgi:hypothetical protein